MKTNTLLALSLLALLCGLGACGNNTPSIPTNTAVVQPVEVVPTETIEKPTPTPSPSPEPEASPALFEEAPCPMELPAGAIEGEHITCGYVQVPEMRTDSEGKAIRLAVAVIHSDGNSPAPDPLVMLAGGPGQSALTDFPPLLAQPGLEGFRTGRDVILVEQRGTRYSPPFLKCDEVHAFQLATLDQALSPEEQRGQHLEAVTDCHDGFVAEGINLSAYNSLESAADVVDVIDALGYDVFNLYGGSYGSLLAQHIMRDYPDRVRSVILDAVSPLRHEPNLLYKAHSMDRALRLLFSQCAADPDCNDVYPDLETVFFDTVDHLNAEPATVDIQDPTSGKTYPMLLTGDELIVSTRDLLYTTAILPDLPQAVYAAAEGDYTLFGLLRSALLFQGNLADGLYKSVVCSELADFDESDMADPEGLYPQVASVIQSLIAEVMLDPCGVWDVEPLDAYAKESVASDIPTLVLSGEFDPTVPPNLGHVAAEGLANSYVYSYPGVGHSTIAGGECPVSMMLSFLDDPSHAPDESCLAEAAGLAFRIPVTSVQLEPFVDSDRGFSGLVPAGWQELAPANLARGSSAVDVAYFVLAAEPIPAAEMITILASQLGFAPEIEPVSNEEVGSFAWQLYAFDLRGYPADLALAEAGGKSYFVFMISPPDEHDTLYSEIFVPAVEAMAPLSPDT